VDRDHVIALEIQGDKIGRRFERDLAVAYEHRAERVEVTGLEPLDILDQSAAHDIRAIGSETSAGSLANSRKRGEISGDIEDSHAATTTTRN
jgi:hypothetical protein